MVEVLRLHGDVGVEKAWQRAVELAPDDPVIAEHLGDAYLKAGQPQKALQMYRRSLKLDPNRTGLREKIHHLEKR